MKLTIKDYLALEWGDMSPAIYKESHALMVGTTHGTECVPCDMLGLPDPPRADDEQAVHEFAQQVSQYLEGGITDMASLCEPVSGYVCRMSASGYMDCTPWEYCETEGDILRWLESEAEQAGVSAGPDKATRVNQCTSDVGEICYYDSCHDGSSVEGLSTVSYGDMRRASKSDVASRDIDQLWLRVTHAGGSDYSGGSVTLANYRELRKMQSDNEYTLLTGFGGHGTYAIYVRLDASDELWETVVALADYPVINDNVVSEVEHEWRQEAMADAVHDTADRIVRTVCPYMDDMEAEEFDKVMGNLTPICETCAQAFEEWEYEHASAYARPEKIVENVLASEEWLALHADIFTAILGPVGSSNTLVRVTSEAGACVEEYSPFSADFPHEDIITLCQREYGVADITVEIFNKPCHPLDNESNA